jgi:hypothetical protein
MSAGSTAVSQLCTSVRLLMGALLGLLQAICQEVPAAFARRIAASRVAAADAMRLVLCCLQQKREGAAEKNPRARLRPCPADQAVHSTVDQSPHTTSTDQVLLNGRCKRRTKTHKDTDNFLSR